jgi:2-dehydropantoate 2-reductase
VRILIVGAGVIGSVYAGRLLEAGHSVTLCARGQRINQLRECGLIVEDAQTGRTLRGEIPVVAVPDTGRPCDFVLVAVRRDQMVGTLSLLSDLDADVMFFGNAAGLTAQLTGALGRRTMFGFPAAGGISDGATVRYVQIRQQKTMLADPSHRKSARVKAIAAMLGAAGFPTHLARDAEEWLIAHAAFVVPIALALYRVEVDPRRLAADDDLVATMVRATREAFQALRQAGNAEIPSNLRALYLRMPQCFAVHYWRTTMAGPRGELCFAGHTRAAPDEMASLASVLRSALNRIGRPTPALATLLADQSL